MSIRVVERKHRHNGSFIEIVQVPFGHRLYDQWGRKYVIHCIDHGTTTASNLILNAREVAANSLMWCRQCLDARLERNSYKKPSKRGRPVGSKNRAKVS